MSALLDADGVQAAVARMAVEIDRLAGDAELILVGIRRGGVPLADRLAGELLRIGRRRPSLGSIDITLYRDDLYSGLEAPTFGATELPGGIEGRGVFLVDDVLFTGRTVRAALFALHDYGRPRWVRLAALVDRGHRELPIQGDVIGMTVPTERSDNVVVDIGPVGASDDAVTVRRR
jgi:pyrimidine operon attenuation protein/uracil phosphoribosyltransferase